jgi:hypothetical protein
MCFAYDAMPEKRKARIVATIHTLKNNAIKSIVTPPSSIL